jgi:hypothetical protein
MVLAQVSKARAAKPPRLEDLLNEGETWVVE